MGFLQTTITSYYVHVAVNFGATKNPAKYYPIVWQKNPDFQAAIKFSATKKPAKYYPIV